MTLFSSSIPLALYIHFPWCVKKCPYCDFNSHALKTEVPERQYIDALLADLSRDLAYVDGRPIHSIFMGGGTPSLFSAQALERLLRGIRQQIEFDPDIEVTLEANPGTIERGRFVDYASIGINRISLGVQSFQSAQLKKLGRIHSVDDIYRSVDELHAAGLNNFNLDIMHGLPDQTTVQAMHDIQQALRLNPTHFSWYQLTIEPNTIFYSKPPDIPGDQILTAIEAEGLAYIQAQGFQQYEVSAYSHAGYQCRHNVNYWQFGDYLGIGAGAHAKLTDRQNGKITRLWKRRQPASYLNPDVGFVAGSQTLRREEIPLEFMLNALRLNDGFTVQQFEAVTGLEISSIDAALQQGYARQLLVRECQRIKTTELGRRFLNDVLRLFA